VDNVTVGKGSRRTLVDHLLESLDSSKDMVLVTSIEGPLTYVNEAGMKILGIEDWVDGLRLSEFRPSWAIRYSENEIIPTARRLGNWRGESVFLNTSGEEVAVIQSVQIIPTTESNNETILIIARQISDSSEEEDVIENYEEYYRLFFHKSAEAIYLLNAATKRVLYANPAFFDYLGYTPEDLKNLYIYDFVFHEKKSIDGFLATVWESKEMFLGARQWKRKDGSVIDVFVSLTLLVHQGKPVYVVTARDISVELAAQRRYFESESRYELLVEHLNDGLLQVDNEDRILFVNNRLCELTGYSEGELVGNYAFQILLEKEDQKAMRERVSRRTKAPFSDRYEIRLRLKSGEVRWFQNSTTRMTDESGNVHGSIGLLRDIHDQKETERRLEYKMRELDTFVYKASHDLKAPLNSLQGLLDLALEENKDPEIDHFLQLMGKKTVKLHSVLMGLLEVSVMQEGKINATTFPLRPFCLSIFESFDQKAEEAGISLRCTVPEDYELTTDQKILESIIQNLVHNAINYHRKDGEGRFVELSVEPVAGKPCIRVKDNGPGIPEEIQEKVFDMFYRGHNDSEGSGLGLYIVKTGVEKLGGTVKLISKVGGGTVFELGRG
jgi:PAS domain S-box-containing protein